MGNLFVGPYRQNNIIGLTSRTIFKNLLESKPSTEDLICRNLFIDSTVVTELSESDIISHEAYSNQKINTLIQHTPSNAIYLSKYLDNNICIPILNNQVIKDEDLYRLSMCTKVLVDTLLMYQRLSPYLNNIHYIGYKPKLNLASTKDINLGPFHSTYKFYFIGSFAKNRDLLFDLFISFIIFSQTNDNISLVIILSDIDKKDLDTLQNSINSIYKQLDISNVFIKITCINISNNLSSIIDYHKYNDVYLNINEDNYGSLNRNYAKYFGKDIIDAHKLVYEKVFIRNNISNYDGFLTPTQYSIFESLITHVSKNTNDQEQSSTPIETLVWN